MLLEMFLFKALPFFLFSFEIALLGIAVVLLQ